MLTVDPQTCTLCGLCQQVCTAEIISLESGLPAMTESGADHCISCQHCLAVCPTGALSFDGRHASECAPPGPLPSSEHFLNALRQRRSIRRFKPVQVEESILTQLQSSLAWSPTGCNDHRLHAVFVNGTAAIERFRLPTYRAARFLHRTYLPRLFSRRLHHFLSAIISGEDVIYRQAPHMLVISTPGDAPCANFDPVIAMSQFELYANTFGIGTLWCGFALHALRIFPHLRRPLALPRGYRVGAVMLFGYPEITFQRATCPEPIIAHTLE